MTPKTFILAAFALSVSVPALADSGATFVNNEIGWEAQSAQSTKTRDQVVAELQAAQRSGIAANNEYGFPSAGSAFSSTLSRSEVQRDITEVSEAERDAVHRVYGPQHGRGS